MEGNQGTASRSVPATDSLPPGPELEARRPRETAFIRSYTPQKPSPGGEHPTNHIDKSMRANIWVASHRPLHGAIHPIIIRRWWHLLLATAKTEHAFSIHKNEERTPNKLFEADEDDGPEVKTREWAEGSCSVGIFAAVETRCRR